MLTITSSHQVYTCTGSESNAWADCQESDSYLSTKYWCNQRGGRQSRHMQTTLTKSKVAWECNYITSDVHWAPANFHPHVHRLRKAATEGDRTTSGRIIPTIDFCCWVLQTETVGLSGQDPSALSLTKRVFSGLIRQKAYYWWSQPPPQLDKENGCPLICRHRTG